MICVVVLVFVGFQMNIIFAGEGSPKTSRTVKPQGCSYKGKNNLNQGKHSGGKTASYSSRKHK